MTHNDYTRKILNIKDENIYFFENCLEIKNINNVDTQVYKAILTYIPDSCPCCGIINYSHKDIIKWGFKHNCKVKLPKVSNFNVLLILSKQRFYCKRCNNTFLASTPLVDKFHNISNNTDLTIKLDLMTKSSEKDIAKRNNVSVSKVNRILDSISKKTILPAPSLPKEMNWDEFKATNDTTTKMAFIVTNNEKGTIFDILESRRRKDLNQYFRRYSLKERNKVRLISVDMYKPYISLAEELFKKADIVIDRFHIVLQAYNALNITRVKLCYKSNPNHNKLRKYWRLIVKNENDLDDKEKSYSKHFRKHLTQKEIVTYLINTDETLKATYECYQGLINSIKNKDFHKFNAIIQNQNKNISEHMKKALRTYKRFLPYIENSFKYEINNGIIEGTNNLIKCIKRISFGYRSFSHFKARILLIKGHIIYTN